MKGPIALLLCLLLVCGMAACGGTANTVADVPTPTAEPTPRPDIPIIPQSVVTTPQPGTEAYTEEVTVQVHNEQEVIPMTEVTGSFAAAGGPDFRLLVDKNRYQVNDVGGCCYVTLRTGMSGDVYIELGFRADTKASDLDAAVLDEYGIMGVKKELGEVWLGNNKARHLQGQTVQNVFDVYLIDTEGGCLTAVLSTTTSTKAHYARLTASLETLEIFE